MKHRLIGTAVCLLVSVLSLPLSAQQPGRALEEWEDPRVLGLNKEPAHATFVPYPDEFTARRGALAFAPGAARVPGSPFVRSLNGIWKFHWVKEPAARPADFYRPEYDVSAWKEIKVPSNWEL